MGTEWRFFGVGDDFGGCRSWGPLSFWGAVCGSSSEGKGRRADFPLLVVEGEMLESL